MAAISFNHAEQCSKQATHLHVTECCTFSQMGADQQQGTVKLTFIQR